MFIVYTYVGLAIAAIGPLPTNINAEVCAYMYQHSMELRHHQMTLSQEHKNAFAPMGIECYTSDVAPSLNEDAIDKVDSNYKRLLERLNGK